jgi:hypothetical protein
MKATHYFFAEAGPFTFDIPENFTCAHVTAIDGTLTIQALDGPTTAVMYFLPDGETLPFWKIESPYRAVRISTTEQASCRGWYIMH